jgi:hypothetical protein
MYPSHPRPSTPSTPFRPHATPFRPHALRRASALLLTGALVGASSLGASAAHAQQEAQSAPAHDAGSTTTNPRGAVTVRPGRRAYVTPDMRAAIVSATDTSGSVDAARRGMAAAYAAISILPGYTNVPANEVANAMQNIKADALRLPEYQHLKKALKADRVLSVTLTPGDAGADAATYTAVIELYDTNTGGLAGRGEETFTASGDTAPASVPATSIPGASVARGPLMEGTQGTLTERAIDGAVARAVFELNAPVIRRGVVLNTVAQSENRSAPMYTRISLGEIQGLRSGAPVEYLSPQGQRIAFGTIIDLGRGESLATVAPESAFANIYVNCEVRNLDNPPLARSGRSASGLDEKEWKAYEARFGVALVAALAISLKYF